MEDSDARLMEMLAAQAAHREVDSLGADEESIAASGKLSPEEKRDTLQKSLNMAASNGDVERVRRLVQGSAKEFIDVNMPDEEGTVPLIYASCFVSSLMPLYLARTIVQRWGWSISQLKGPSLSVPDTRLMFHFRDTKMSLVHFLMPVLLSTSKIETNGVL